MGEQNDCCDRPRRGLGVLRIIGLTIGGIALAVVLAFLFGWLVQYLWNWLMPSLFGFKTITYWQGFGLVVLAKLLFGGSPGGHHGHSKKHRSMHRKFHGPWNCCTSDEECNDDEWKPKGSHDNWKHYSQYWKEEGKEAFERYLERIERKS